MNGKRRFEFVRFAMNAELLLPRKGPVAARIVAHKRRDLQVRREHVSVEVAFAFERFVAHCACEAAHVVMHARHVPLKIRRSRECCAKNLFKKNIYYLLLFFSLHVRRVLRCPKPFSFLPNSLCGHWGQTNFFFADIVCPFGFLFFWWTHNWSFEIQTMVYFFHCLPF